MNWIRKHRPSPGTAFGFAALMVALGGVAFAAIPESDGTIHGCTQRNSGDLRVVSSASDCRNSEDPISWNRQGPPGGGVAARMRGGPVTLGPNETKTITLSGNSWTQGANEFNEIFTEVDATTPCTGGLRGNVAYFVDGVERVRFGIGQGTLPFQFSLFEPGAPTPHTLTMTAREQCGVQLTINSVKVDVLGFS